MTEKDHINESELDALLNQLYLDEHTPISDEEAEFVMAQDYGLVPEPAKEQALLKRLQKGKGGAWFPLLGIVVVCVLSLAALWYGSQPNTRSAKEEAKVNHKGAGTVEVQMPVSENDRGPAASNSLPMPDTSWREPFGRMPVPARQPEDSAAQMPKVAINEYLRDTGAVPYPLPVLSDAEKRSYRRVKEQMLQKLVSLDKSLYTKVPPDRVRYKGESVILEPFTIRNLSISNLEYKTFLADLLMQQRRAEYLEAMVAPGNWAGYNAPGLANTYLQDERYNDFPVVNVSIAGARLFCKWLEEEAAMYVQQHKLKEKHLKLRLPTDKEWIYLAWTGYAKVPYTEAYTTLFDQGEGLVDGSFPKRMEQVKRRARQKDTLYDILAVNKYGWTEKEILQFIERAFAAYRATPADTIYPERMKLFSKYGSVSELTQQSGTGHYWLSGKLWKDRQAYLVQKEAFDRQGASPFVGFRVVVTNDADPEYKNPFW